MSEEDYRELTFGEKAVGLTFNPSNDSKVYKIKELYAQIIDLLNLPGPEQPYTFDQKPLVEHAIREAQTAQMWAVKAITYPY